MAMDLYEKRREQMFPKLTPAQLARFAAHATRQVKGRVVRIVEAIERERRIRPLVPGRPREVERKAL